jgi:PAS domain S-box-containing protein/putative nucleotidyltransferase with HDIG domain
LVQGNNPLKTIESNLSLHSDVKAMHLNWLSLKFTGATAMLETPFRAHFITDNLFQIRVALFMGALIYGLVGILDALVMPQQKHITWLIRYAFVCPALLAAMTATFFPRLHRYLQPIISFVFAFSGLGVVLMIIVAPAPISYYYYAGLIVIYMVGYSIIYLRFLWASLSGWLIMILYEIAAVLTNAPAIEMIISSSFLISGNLAGMLVSYAIEYASRRNYFLMQLLAREELKIKEANDQLEQRIAERTAALEKMNRALTKEIAERRLAQESLRESEEKYSELAHFLPQIVFETDIKGNIIFVNHAAHSISGYSPEEFNKGLNVLQLLVPEEWDRARFNIQGLLHGKELQSNEFTFLRKDGHTFPVITNAIPIVRNNQTMGLRGLVIDITKRKKTEETLKETLENLMKALSTTIQVMVSAIEVRDPYTAGHQIRSTDLARAIAAEMGLSQDKIEAIRMAGPIHDIGKLSVPAEILSKPTKLTNIAFALIKEHARTGFEMLKDVKSPWPLAEIVYQHHERMDGSGYPRNLKGDDILIEARILAIADVVESMASHRPYRPTLGIKAALEEIEKNKGVLYDADAVDACLKLFREKGFQLEGV